MAGFDLIPLDGGGPIHLPEGETVLGRGPFLGVMDKRVSRKHGIIENLDGQLRIKPTHLNPCFCQTSLDDPPQPLDRDQWHRLHQGDIFSLLPGKHVYKVVAVATVQGTQRNSQAFEEECDFSKSPPRSPEPNTEPRRWTRQDRVGTQATQEPAVQPTQEAMQKSTLRAAENRQHKETEEPKSPCPSYKEETEQSKEEEIKEMELPTPERKKRVLPAWMMANNSSSQSPSSTPKGAVAKAKITAATTATAKPGTSTPKLSRATIGSSGEESEHSEAELRPRKRQKRMKSDDEAETIVTSTAKRQWAPTGVVQREESDNLDMEVEEDEDPEEEKEAKPSTSRWKGTTQTGSNPEPKDQVGKQKYRQPVKKAETHSSNGGSESSSIKPRAQLRTPCPYGKDCYRKNPLHFQESSHPGDSDYEEEEDEDEDGDRPECPYGTDCYRKNPLHRKEYKHTKRPGRSTRTVKKIDDDDDDDDFADDDSFINDDSEDVGDDSDYMPPDSDDSGKEDVKRLQKEAKVFLKRRK